MLVILSTCALFTHVLCVSTTLYFHRETRSAEIQEQHLEIVETLCTVLVSFQGCHVPIIDAV